MRQPSKVELSKSCEMKCCTQMTNRRRLKLVSLFALLAVFVMLHQNYLVMNNFGKPQFFAQNDVVLVYTEEDQCLRWGRAFPLHTILLVGYRQRPKSLQNCVYLTRQDGSIDHLTFALTFHPRHIHVVDGGVDPEFCLQASKALGDINRTTGILYEDLEQRVYDSSRHWGYGGSQKPGQYYACEDLKSPIITATIPLPLSAACSQVLPPMTIAPGVYALTTNSCITLQRRAFWMLPFFKDYGSSRENATTLSFIAQKLMWSTGNILNVRTLCSNESSTGLHFQNGAEHVVNKLTKMSCDTSEFGDCLKRFVKDIVPGKNHIHSRWLELDQWINIIRDGQVTYPRTYSVKPSMCQTRKPMMSYSPVQAKQPKDSVHANVNKSNELMMTVNMLQRNNVQSSTCKPWEFPAQKQKPWIQWKNILLIVVFNTAKYKSIPYYEALYRPFFPNIVYCGPSFPKMESFSYQFITFGSTPEWLNAGSLHYRCLIEASKLGYDVDGYLQAADDVILMPHRLQHFNLSKVWSFRLDNMVRTDYRTVTICEGPAKSCGQERVAFWHTFKNTTLNALDEIRDLANTSTSSVFERCAANIESLFGGPTWSLRVLSDIVYVPTRLIKEVTEVLSIFLKNQVYLEIAIPTVIHCVTPQEDIDPLYTHFHNIHRSNKSMNVTYSPDVEQPADPVAVVMSHRVYVGGRGEPWNHFNPQLMTGATFYHPFKMGLIGKKENNGLFFCLLSSFFDDPGGSMSVFSKYAGSFAVKKKFKGKGKSKGKKKPKPKKKSKGKPPKKKTKAKSSSDPTIPE